MFRRLKMLLIVPCLLLFAVIAVAETTPMLAFYPPTIYAYDSLTGLIDTVDNSPMQSPVVPDMNPAQTLMIYNYDGVINLYDTLSKLPPTPITTVTPLNHSEGGNVTYFNANGEILFVDSADYTLKRMNTAGESVVTVASPTAGYNFTYFALSPDRSRIAIIENVQGCTEMNYYTCNTERLVLLNADGTNPTVIKTAYLGEWNFISWRQDSQALLYYHHHFDGSGIPANKTPGYTLFDLSGGPVTTTDFTGRSWGYPENVCVFTRNGNLLSLQYAELYDGRTGSLIADVSSTVPYMMIEGIMGRRINGDLYFAESDRTNFHLFVESGSLGSLYATFPGGGVHQYNGTTWSQVTPNSPETIVVSGSNLYGDFGLDGIWMYNGTTWSQTTPSDPQMMTVSGSTLYGTFSGAGIWMCNGTSWSQVTPSNPEAILASGLNLYGDFGSAVSGCTTAPPGVRQPPAIHK